VFGDKPVRAIGELLPVTTVPPVPAVPAVPGVLNVLTPYSAIYDPVHAVQVKGILAAVVVMPLTVPIVGATQASVDVTVTVELF
jgi:ABC-type transport system involved in cytochrome c biogenesis permease component